MVVEGVKQVKPFFGMPEQLPKDPTNAQVMKRGRQIAILEEKARDDAVAAGTACRINSKRIAQMTEQELSDYLMRSGRAYQDKKSTIVHSTADTYTSMYNDFEKKQPEQTKTGCWPKPTISGGNWMDNINNALMPLTLLMFLGQMLASFFMRGQQMPATNSGLQATTSLPSSFVSNPVMAANAANN